MVDTTRTSTKLCVECGVKHRSKFGYCKKHFYYSPQGLLRNKKIAESKMGDKHPLWSGDNVSYDKLHKWVRRRLIEPKVCDNCHKEKTYKRSLDLACKGEYSRALENWWFLCRGCHMQIDGRAESARYYKTDGDYYKKVYGIKRLPRPIIDQHSQKPLISMF